MSALLPQFLDSRGHMMVPLTALLSCTIVVDVIVLGSYAFLADRGRRLLDESRLWKVIECVFGAALVGFAIGLLRWRRVGF